MLCTDLKDTQRAKIFECLQNVDLDHLESLDYGACALPFLVKLLINPYFTKRKKLLKLIYNLKKANDMVQLLQSKPIESTDLVIDETQISNLVSLFESGSPRERLKLVTIEYLRIQEQVRQQINQSNSATSTQHAPTIKFLKSSIFDNPLYMEDVSLCLFALLYKANVPVISLLDLIETLLYVKHGPIYIIQLVLNMPDRCQEVCQSLVTLGESIDEGSLVNEISDNRAAALRAICQLSSSVASKVRALTIQLRLVPSLTILLMSDQLNKVLIELGPTKESESKSQSEMISCIINLEKGYENATNFVIGILQDEDETTRTWFAKFIKTAQQKRADVNHESILTEFRSHIVSCMKKIVPIFFETDIPGAIEDYKVDDSEHDDKFLNRRLVQATATLRYFCCIRGIGMLKLNQEESDILFNLITCRPPVTSASVNFVTVGVCSLLICSSIINSPKEERRAADWLKWLMKEFNSDSVNEFINTTSKHFHSNQINQISELVCSTVGMRLQIKAFISKCKPLFAQEIFSNALIQEQTVEETDPRELAMRYQAPVKDWIHKKIYEYDEVLRSSMVGIRPKSITQDKINELKQQLTKCLSKMRDDPLSLVQTINRILLLPKIEVWTFIDPFIENWSRMVDLDISPNTQNLIKALTKMWWKLNTIHPRELWIMTINSLRRIQPTKLCAETDYSFEDIAYDPLIVLKCDSRVFRNQRLLDIVLHILSAFLEASKRFLQDQIDEQPNRQKDNRGLEELRSTLVLAQTSAAIQILLEHCLPTHEERLILDKQQGGYELNEKELLFLQSYNESVACICEHLHQVFIVDTNLAKLVHFQTYPSDLLAITTEKVPSMHICLDYIPELLSQPDLHKQVFVIQLTSHLCEKYAITKSLNCAKLCFNVAFTLLQLLPSDKRALFYVPTLPALLRLCKVFPILQEDANIILNQVRQVTLAHMASTSSRLSLSSSNPFEGLEKMTWLDVEKLMSNLSLDESLFLCIQKSKLELKKRDGRS